MLNFKVFLQFIFSICLLLFFAFPLASQEDNRTVINIENANNTRYEKDKTTNNDMIILTGAVKISVARGSNKNSINADIVRYDRTAEMIYAEGNVSLEQTTASSGGQTVTASALMFNARTLEGIFDDGRAVQKESDAINLPSGSTLIVASNIFGRSESNTIAFKDGVLTFCDDENPHWNIKASRIWLLPGGEFAFLNARVFVGPVPVLYLPAFYYPKDELIFNPVFSYTRREGYSVQTTAYVYGRKPLDTTTTSTSSEESDASEKIKALFNFVKPSKLKDQKIEGLMLHNLDTDYTGNTTNYLKIMGDYYSNLGFMVGLDGVFRPQKYISNIDLNAKLGFSNTIFSPGANTYTAYGPSGKKYFDKSNLLGLKLPFRYSASFKMSMSTPLSLSLSLPVYSDPFFNDDFSERSETMDWISYLLDFAGSDNDEDDTITEVSSFSWTLNSSYTVPLPAVIKPYINSLSLSLNSSVAFSTMNARNKTENNEIVKRGIDTSGIDDEDVSQWASKTPLRKFYYPSQVTPATVNLTLSGTLFDFSSTGVKSAKSTKTPDFSTPLVVPEEFMTDAEKAAYIAANKTEEDAGDEGDLSEDASHSENKKDEGAAEDLAKDELAFLGSDVFPVLSGVSDSVTKISGLAVSSKYSIKPSFSTQLAYSSENLYGAGDFDFKNLRSSMYTLKIPVTLDNSFSYGGSFFSFSNSHTFNPVFQKHPYISTDVENGGYTESAASSLKKTDYSAEKRDWTNTNSISLKPFAYISAIKDTGVTWRNTIKIVRTEFLADKEDWEENPEWDYIWAEWDDEDAVTTNALDLTLAANQMDNKFSQNLTFTMAFKPQVEAYYATVNLGFPYTTLAFDTGIKRKSQEDDEWVKQPFKQSLSFSMNLLNSTLKFSESYNYDLEEKYHDSLKLSLSWHSLSFAYTMSYTYGFDMNYDDSGNAKGWQQRADKEFLPYSLSFSYSPSTKTIYTWKNRISLGLGLSTSVVADLLKPTSSYFTFAPSISFKIHEFLTFTFTSSSRNSVIYRYFGNKVGLSGETNFFKDLINSFRFDDDSLREMSGFKLQSLQFTITHEMHDWDFSMSFKIEPRLLNDGFDKGKETASYYDFNPYITISILWRPMGAMKTEIIDKYGEWNLQ